MKVLGTVRTISELQTFDGTEFTKKDLILMSNDGKTPYKLEFHKEKSDLLNNINLGQEVIVEFVIRGRFYDVKDEQGNTTAEKAVSNSLIAIGLTAL